MAQRKSKPETPELKARRLVKTLPLSFAAIRRLIDKDGMVECRASCRGVGGTLRFIIRMKGRNPESWTMALLLDNRRIDCIDWEQTVHGSDGKKCSGWHRHFWTPERGDKNKECLKSFSPATGSDFIQGGLAIMGVRLKKEGSDDDKLPID